MVNHERLAQLIIDPKMLCRLFQAPPGYRVLSVHADSLRRSLILIIEGADLPEVTLGQEPPILSSTLCPIIMDDHVVAVGINITWPEQHEQEISGGREA
jgi:hypothetical protein